MSLFKGCLIEPLDTKAAILEQLDCDPTDSGSLSNPGRVEIRDECRDMMDEEGDF